MKWYLSLAHYICADKEPSLPDAFACLLPLAANWKTIGTLVGVKNHLLEIVAADGGGAKNCLIGMLSEWLKQVHPEPTWAALYDAVKEVDERKAEMIRERFTAEIGIS